MPDWDSVCTLRAGLWSTAGQMGPSHNPTGVLCPAFLIGCIRAARVHIQSYHAHSCTIHGNQLTKLGVSHAHKCLQAQKPVTFECCPVPPASPYTGLCPKPLSTTLLCRGTTSPTGRRTLKPRMGARARLCPVISQRPVQLHR